MGRRKRGQRIHGILVVDKPQDFSSNAVLQRCRRALDAQKAGHTGALDPLATGVLPICFGDATKYSQYLLDADKAYLADVCFGETRSTGDAEGEVLTKCDASGLTQENVEQALDRFRGPIAQIPPMYSALKKDGKPLYKLARQGIEIDRAARQITIYSLVLQDFKPGEQPVARIAVRCSKGTYIRTLGEDIGEVLGVGAFLSGLRRTHAGPFDLSQALTLDQVESVGASVIDQLLPIDAGLSHLPRCIVNDHEAEKLLLGQAVNVLNTSNDGIVRIARVSQEFIGLGTVSEGHVLSPLRMIATDE